MTPQELKEKRQGAGITQSQLSKAIGVAPATISQMETGRRKIGDKVANYFSGGSKNAGSKKQAPKKKTTKSPTKNSKIKRAKQASRSKHDDTSIVADVLKSDLSRSAKKYIVDKFMQ